MARAAGLWLAAMLCFQLYICYNLVDGLPQGSIIRAKRELDENFEDALFGKEEGLLSKRETKDGDEKSDAEEESSAKDSPDESVKKSDTGDKVAIDSAASVEARRNEAGESEEVRSKKDETQSKTEKVKDVQAETRHNVEGKNADNVSEKLLKSGMDSNVDIPMTNSDLIKKYDAAEDTSNGELLGMSKRAQIVTHPTDTKTEVKSEARKDTIEQPTVATLKTDATVETHEDRLSKRQTILTPKLYKRSEKETHDIQEAGAPSHFQVDDKSADLEINANSAGVKVKAKPASLQVVSRPGQHGGIAPPMMPFMPPPVPVMHHLPHHHRHHHHHHHRRHHYEEPIYFAPYHHEGFMPYGHYEGHEGGYGWGEPHFFNPYHHEERFGYGHPNWGEGEGDGYHLYGRHRIDEGGLYGRSTVETARDPRLSTPAALDGFNSGIALPDMDQRFTRISQLDGPQVRYQHLDDDFKGFGPPTMEEERMAERGEYRYHVPRTPMPEEEDHHKEKRLKRRYRPDQPYREYVPRGPRYVAFLLLSLLLTLLGLYTVSFSTFSQFFKIFQGSEQF